MKNNIDPEELFLTADLHVGHSNILKYCHRPFLNPDEQKRLDDIDAIEPLVKAYERDNVGDPRPVLTISPSEYRRLKEELARLFFRPCKESTDRMDAHLIDRINETVPIDADLRIIGDFCYGVRHSYYERASEYRNRIICRNVHIVWGNHDKKSIHNLFVTAKDYDEIYVGNDLLIVQHYAPAIWNKMHRGAIAAYGHSHSTAEPMLDKLFPSRRSIDVGVDNANKILGEYRPFNFKRDILPRMKKKAGMSIDHHVGE